jgi:hypothetical protein
VSVSRVSLATGTEGQVAPPFNNVVAFPARAPGYQPQRIQRTRRRANFTPAGARYVGRPSIYGNPFERRPRIGHARSVILYGSWVRGELTPHILSCAGFGEDEIIGLERWRRRLLPQLIHLRGFDLQCRCPLTSAWCHADFQLRLCNGPIHILERLAA